MSYFLASAVISLPESPFPPLAVGFFGLGTGYLIYGTEELIGYPPRDERVDFATGVWGLWMPGFMQFLAGTYLFAGLTLFGTFKTPALYMAALAFTAYGVHWFALGWNRIRRADVRVNVGMCVAYLCLSILGIIVFFGVHDDPVGGVFIGLAGVYATAWLRGRRDLYHRAGLVVALSFAALAAPVQVVVGDWAGRTVAKNQPLKLDYKLTQNILKDAVEVDFRLGWQTRYRLEEPPVSLV